MTLHCGPFGNWHLAPAIPIPPKLDYNATTMPLYSIETYGELHPHLEQEWLLTNGLGGFASGTVVGCNTRRYHGLLCGATLPPVGRILMLNRLGEILRIQPREDEPLELSINQFGDQFHPRGDRFLRAGKNTLDLRQEVP